MIVDDRRQGLSRGRPQEPLRTLAHDQRQQRRLLAQRVLLVATDVVEARQEEPQRSGRSVGSGDDIMRRKRQPCGIRGLDACCGGLRPIPQGQRLHILAIAPGLVQMQVERWHRSCPIVGAEDLRQRLTGQRGLTVGGTEFGIVSQRAQPGAPEIVRALPQNAIERSQQRAVVLPRQRFPEAELLKRGGEEIVEGYRMTRWRELVTEEVEGLDLGQGCDQPGHLRNPIVVENHPLVAGFLRRRAILPERRRANLSDHLRCQCHGRARRHDRMIAASQPSQRGAAEGIASTSRVEDIHLWCRDMGTKRSLHHPRAAIPHRDKEQPSRMSLRRLNGPKQPPRLAFVHEEDIGLLEELTDVLPFILNNSAIGAGRDAGRSAPAAGTQEIQLSPGRLDGGNVDQAIVREVVGQIVWRQSGFGAPESVQQPGCSARLMLDLKAWQLLGRNHGADPLDALNNRLQRRRDGAGARGEHGGRSPQTMGSGRGVHPRAPG